MFTDCPLDNWSLVFITLEILCWPMGIEQVTGTWEQHVAAVETYDLGCSRKELLVINYKY